MKFLEDPINPLGVEKEFKITEKLRDFIKIKKSDDPSGETQGDLLLIKLSHSGYFD